jgi:hypothetical protein
LKFVEVIVKLLETLDECCEAGGQSGIRSYPGLYDALFVQQGFQSKRKLMLVSACVRGVNSRTHLCFFLQIKHIDFFYLSFLQLIMNTAPCGKDKTSAYQPKEEDFFIRS